MIWASAAGQKKGMWFISESCLAAGLFCRFGSLKKKTKKNSSSISTVRFKINPKTFFFLSFLRPFGKWKDHLRQCFFGGAVMQAWLALRLGVEGLQAIRVRRVPPHCTTPSVSHKHTAFTHTDSHVSLQLQFEWQMQVCNPPSPNPEQPQHKKKNAKSYILWLELNTKTEQQSLTKRGGKPHLDPSWGGNIIKSFQMETVCCSCSKSPV